jgi:alkanesulfonate monooxygenase SsuD/methylene tetrahydromethanopterin reductase-like flavin-dependent oxidoreductase (luciferase family)
MIGDKGRKASGVRMGLMLRVTGERGPAALYREAVELAVAAEELGFEVIWLTQHHFGSAGSPMPSPLLLLAAIAERTKSIRLGTSVITATAENPIRVAEDAAVLDVLSGGRVELGLGAAVGPDTLAAFGLIAEESPADLEKSALAVMSLLRGATVGAQSRIEPADAGLADRMWVATNTGRSTGFAGPNGLGLITNYQPGRLPARSDYLMDYMAGCAANGHAPRVALVRSIYPTHDRAATRSLLEPHAANFIRRGRPGHEATPSTEAYFHREDFHWGYPEDVARAILEDPGWPFATDLLAGMLSARLSPAEQMEPMRLLAEEVGPLIGWLRG